MPYALLTPKNSALMMETVGPSETSVNFYQVRGVTYQKTAVDKLKLHTHAIMWALSYLTSAQPGLCDVLVLTVHRFLHIQ
jgi:hypothetical protein